MPLEARSDDPLQEVTVGETLDELASLYAQMLKVMQGHRANLRVTCEELDAVKLVGISNEEVKDYIGRVDGAVKYVMQNWDNKDIHQFVKTCEKFQEDGEDIIMGFNDALAVWDRFLSPTGVSPSDFDEGRDVFQKRLRKCRSKIKELLDVFQNFDEPS